LEFTAEQARLYTLEFTAEQARLYTLEFTAGQARLYESDRRGFRRAERDPQGPQSQL